MTTTKESIVRLRVESQDGEKALRSFKLNFTELNQAIELGAKAFRLLDGVASGTFRTLARGDKIIDLSRAFESLKQQTGAYTLTVQQLRAATEGALNNTVLMEKANRALLRGIPSDKILEMFGAVKKLSDAMGRDLNQSIDGTIAGLTGGSQKMLKSFGVMRKEGEDVADTIKKIKDQADAFGDSAPTAADAGEQLTSAWENAAAQFDQAFSESKSLEQALSALAATMEGVDARQLAGDVADIAAALASAANAALSAASAVANFDTNLGYILASSKTKQVVARGDRKELEAAYAQAFAQRRMLGANPDLALLESALKRLPADVAPVTASIRQLGTELDKGQDEAKKLAQEFDKFKTQSLDKLRMDSVGRDLEKAINSLDAGTFARALQGYKQALSETTLSAMRAQFGAAADTPEAKALLDALVNADADDKIRTFAENLEEQTKDALQAATDFFQDVFYDAFTGTAFDVELLLKKILSGVAAGAAGALLPGFGAFGNPQGLGQSIGGGLINSVLGNAASSGVSSILGIGGGAAMSAGGPSLLGSLGFGAAPSTPVMVGGSFVPGAAGAASTGGMLSGAGAWAMTNPISAGLLGALAIGGGLDAIGAFDSGKSGAQKERDALRDRLRQTGLGQDLSFQGAGGQRIRFDYGTQLEQLSTTNPLAGRAAGLVSGLAGIETGFDPERMRDWTNIFANAAMGEQLREMVDGATDFNTVLVNTMTLYEQMGVSAQEVKDATATAFLDGQVSLSQFNEILAAQNQLLANNLEGVGNVGSALEILAKNAEQPRLQMKAFELLLTEFREVGVTSFQAVGDALVDRLGPQAREVFNKLEAAGFHSFEDIKNSGADGLGFLFNNVIGPLQDELEALFNVVRKDGKDAFNSLASTAEQSNSRITESVRTTSKHYNEMIKTVQKAKGAAASPSAVGAGVNSNRPVGSTVI